MGSLFGVIAIVLFGALAGWITAKLMHLTTGFWYNVLLGIGGSIIGNAILKILSGSQASSFVASLLVAILGACLLTVTVRFFNKRARSK